MKTRLFLALSLGVCFFAFQPWAGAQESPPSQSPVHHLRERLRADEPQALSDVLALLLSRAHSWIDWVERAQDDDEVLLVTDAFDAARRYMKRRGPVEERPLRASYVLYRVYATKQGFKNIPEEAYRTRREDVRRYLILWHSFAGQNDPRVVELSRIYLQDWRPFPGTTWRFCDAAAAELQRITHHDFGLQPLKGSQPLAERDAAVKKARQWLSKSGR